MNTYNVILLGKEKELNFYSSVHVNANNLEEVNEVANQYIRDINLNAKVDEIEILEYNVNGKIGIIKEFGKAFFK